MIATALSNILKLFLPSWNFFNDFSVIPRLDIRGISAGQESDWQAAFNNKPEASFARTLFNPHGNLELLQHSYIDRAASWFSDNSQHTGKQFEQTNHHHLLAMIARERIAVIPSANKFQFRLVITNPTAPDETLYTSQAFYIEEESQ